MISPRVCLVEGVSVANIAWERVLPVIVSILIIIFVAIARQYSRTLATVAATMPLNVPLALWIAYSADGANQPAMVSFTEGLLIGIIPTIFFLIVVWLAARAGWPLLPMLGAGYITWALILGVLLLAQFLLKR